MAPLSGQLEDILGMFQLGSVVLKIQLRISYSQGNLVNMIPIFNFSFSCSDSEFTCGDGTCIPLESKCDGMSDCKDELDESDCSVVEFPKQRQYKESLPPIRRLGKEIVPAKVIAVIVHTIV